MGEGLYFSLEQQALYFHGEEIELTRLERQVFQRLAAIRPDVAAREELMMELWNTEEYVSDGTLTTVVCRLRGKLKAACGREVIQTKKGQGYWIP